MDGCAAASRQLRPMLSLLGLLLLALAWPGAAFAASDDEEEYDHETTTLPTEGAHRRLDCEACHGSTVWSPVTRVDHAEVLGTCVSCHNNSIAPGKPADQLVTSNECDLCHSTTAWLPAVFDHSGVSTGCLSCHNNVLVPGKPADHPPTSDNCEACHRTLAWIPLLRMDHGEAIGSCFGCHNGTIAAGQSANHIPTTIDCAACHTTGSWQVSPSRVDHSQIPLAQTQCSVCHEPSAARQPPPTRARLYRVPCGATGGRLV